jgi:hypothetical protein
MNVQIKKQFIIALLLPACLMAVFVLQCYAGSVNSESLTIKTGISVEHVPEAFYGTWRVSAVQLKTDAPRTFKGVSTDIWNLSRAGNVINISNPFTGASAAITLNHASDNTINFSKTQTADNQKLTDVIGLRIEGESFTGMNQITLETFSADGKLIKKKTALYDLKGVKLYGNNIVGVNEIGLYPQNKEKVSRGKLGVEYERI